MDMNAIVSLCKRRGFVFQSSEVYGGINACWDYGPLGVELKLNVKNLWWKAMTLRGDVEGLDAAILMHPKVWEASGHVANFTDPLVECSVCRARFRQDQLDQAKCHKTPSKKPGECEGKLGEPRMFNLMFKTHMGPVEDAGALVYLRPETAQGIYVNFLNVQVTQRRKLPFGICQIGKAFRNEITPGNFIFRTREFEQMEMQFFVKPGDDVAWMDYWKEERMAYYKRYGVRGENLQFHTHGKDELAHYAKGAFDIQYKFPFGWQEIEGIHNRTDFDLKNHAQHSGKNLQYFDDQAKEKYFPYIVETSAGCDRTLLMFLADAYREEKLEGDDSRVVLKFHPDIAPVKVAVLPLMKKDGLGERGQKIFDSLKWNLKAEYDDGGSIGKRYRRQDEIGTPFCLTIDYDTMKDNTVTVRHRDSMKQERVAEDQMTRYLQDHWNLNGAK